MTPREEKVKSTKRRSFSRYFEEFITRALIQKRSLLPKEYFHLTERGDKTKKIAFFFIR